jgi:hypothetical protein
MAAISTKLIGKEGLHKNQMFLQPPAQYPSTKMLQAVNIWVDFY